ncbi:ABC1 kinase family protein [Agitococcus lubricus]|uniref:Putative unusual protein kinase regulating ubiquinone biosynthesis (AarF/ABC1/UbiB family) n=1 Tax=Agitococcus lubricus TaxID=1077255 RepID=A0A2T5ITL9_9GAMM|nr:AarF/UbiB family protein [Agitococcus lubricus]PTQ87226.1 putative unusual protein kinase regulating ubiquinone biosynthesis (AarF/ABC1/UbiB family) [Agitococcus lubricus]
MNRYATFANALKGIVRIGETSAVLATTGMSWLRGNRPPTPRLVRQTFERLGATYVKLGQFVASSPSLFPADYVNEFQYCLDKTPVLPFKYIRRVLEQELKQPIDQIFASIDETPLASASIAQVHAATLVTGESVVIKVQKPDVENILLTDLNFIYWATRIFERLFPKIKFASLSAIVSEIQECMMEEVDFYKEAENIKQFNEFLKATSNPLAIAPQVYPQASSLRVLTMERFYGVPLTDLETIKKYAKDPANTLVGAMNTWFSSLMFCESFHADLHAGNLMVLTDGRIGFIDFGIVGRIKPDTWTATMAFMESIGTGDFEKMADAMMRIGMTSQKVNIDDLAKDLEVIYQAFTVVDPASVLNGSVNDNEINQLMLEIVAVGEKHGIRFPRAFALLFKQILYFDRYIKILAPDMELFNDDRLQLFGQLEQTAKAKPKPRTLH